MQIAVIEFARDVLHFSDATSTEFDENTTHPVIHLMDEQKDILDKGATMRLGNYKCHLKDGSIARRIYDTSDIIERHRHRFEFNNAYVEDFEKNGMTLSGKNEEKNLVEIVELKDHPFFVASQFHPEFKSRPNNPHPLFVGLTYEAIQNKLKHKK